MGSGMNGAISGEQLPPTGARKAWTAQRLGERLQMAARWEPPIGNLGFIFGLHLRLHVRYDWSHEDWAIAFCH